MPTAFFTTHYPFVRARNWPRKIRSLVFALGVGFLLALPQKSPAQAPRTWRLTGAIPIGRDQDFSNIRSVLPRGDGSLVVGDIRNNEISVFNRAGIFSHFIGREGAGPGEFENLAHMGFVDDSLWVIDQRLNRIQFFTADGRSIGTVRRDTSVNMSAVVRGGAIAIAGPGRTDESTLTNRPPTAAVVGLLRNGRIVDTLAWISNRNAQYAIPTTIGGYLVGTQYYSDSGLVIVSSSGTRIFIVDRAVPITPKGATFKITAIDLNGDTAWARSYPYAAKVLSRKDAQAILGVRYASLKKNGAKQADIDRGIFVPTTLPPVTAAFASSDGTLWLRREDNSKTVEYLVIDKDGTIAATLTVPQDVTLVAATSAEAWAIHKDVNDVQTITRYTISR